MKRNAMVTMMVVVLAVVLSACDAVTPMPGALGFTLSAPVVAAPSLIATSDNLADQKSLM